MKLLFVSTLLLTCGLVCSAVAQLSVIEGDEDNFDITVKFPYGWVGKNAKS